MPPSRLIDPATNRPFRTPAKQPRARAVRYVPAARYDAAATNDDNRRHWSNADTLSSAAANSLEVRTKLRSRARYEAANNGHIAGLVLTLANDTVGVGPTLAVLTEDDEVNTAVEGRFYEWAEAVCLWETLHTACQARVRDGEAFLLLTTDPDLTLCDGSPSPVQLDVREVECDQVSTPSGAPDAFTPGWVDGIVHNRRGKPESYHVLKRHPGDLDGFGMPFGDYDSVPADLVIHWFRKTRPGQRRGVPEITAGLPIGSQMRRWTLATLTAAETAADMAILLQTKNPPDTDPGTDEGEPDPEMTFEIQRGLMMRLPDGTEAAGFKSEQPQTTYPMLKTELLKEIGCGVQTPLNVISGSSAEYNFSSARMDQNLYRSGIRIVQEGCRRACVDRVFAAWYREARLVPGFLPDGLPDRLEHDWTWPGFQTIDPLKEAAADTEALANGSTTLARICAEKGQDWQTNRRQRARELAYDMELERENGLPPGSMSSQKPAAPQQPQQPQEPQGPPDDAGMTNRLQPLTEFLLRAEVRDG